jgi:hypothetical protein
VLLSLSPTMRLKLKNGSSWDTVAKANSYNRRSNQQPILRSEERADSQMSSPSGVMQPWRDRTQAMLEGGQRHELLGRRRRAPLDLAVMSVWRQTTCLASGSCHRCRSAGTACCAVDGPLPPGVDSWLQHCGPVCVCTAATPDASE